MSAKCPYCKVPSYSGPHECAATKEIDSLKANLREARTEVARLQAENGRRGQTAEAREADIRRRSAELESLLEILRLVNEAFDEGDCNNRYQHHAITAVREAVKTKPAT